jgi:hypothetical protein
MKIRKIVATGMILGSMIMADIPLLPLELVPEAQAIFGVRRRTAVVAYSAGAASAKAAASQQQAATAPQQAAPVPQPAAPAPSPSAVPIGSVVEALPQKCVAVTVANNQYQDCNNTFYRTAFMGNKLVYVVVDKPI